MQLVLRSFLLGCFPCWLESLHPLVPPAESGTDPMATPLGQTGKPLSAKGTLGRQQHK